MAAEAALLTVLIAAPARAASVEVFADCWKNDCLDYVRFYAAPGERNQVTLRHQGEFAVTIADRGAPLTLGDGCVALDAHSARCTADADAFGLSVRLHLGDGDDTLRIDYGHAFGGAGDDRLSGDSAALNGGPGKDRLTATGAGTLTDGDGPHPARDVYRGAHATVSYNGRRHKLRIDLRAGRAGEDVLRGIESAKGTRHADTIIGTSRRNELVGNGGTDRIAGLGGDDHIDLDNGTADAGAGNDRVRLWRGPARARCGPGQDYADAKGNVRLDGCETLRLFALLEERVFLHPVTTGLVVSGLRCRCARARYEARAGGRIVGRAAKGAKALRLNARGRRLLAARGRLVVDVRSREVSHVFGTQTSEFRTVLRRPRP